MLRLARVTPATVRVLRGLLDADGAVWGLRLVAATGHPAGSVYPILARLEEAGWVSSYWDERVARGPRRRLYELTADGRVSAEAVVADVAGREREPGYRAGSRRPAGGLA